MNMPTANKTAAPRLRDVMRRADRAAASYDDCDFVARLTADGLLERLQPVQIKAQRVLNLGAATGKLSRQLARRFKGSRVISLDLSRAMLQATRRNRGVFSRGHEIQANAEALPFTANSVDVVIANLLLPWLGDPPVMFAEVARVLRPEGVFGFTAFGPDSLRELDAIHAADGSARLREFADMHNIADALLQAGLRDPVVDVDPLRISYRDSDSLFRDLGGFGARNSLEGRRRGLTGKAEMAAIRTAIDAPADGAPFGLSLELIYGHAWGADIAAGDGEFRFDIANLGKRRR